MEGTRNVAARVGGWSARHRAKAIVGWLAFVVLAVMVGGSIGTKLQNEDLNVGEARAADQVIADAFPENAKETVLSGAGTPARPLISAHFAPRWRPSSPSWNRRGT